MKHNPFVPREWRTAILTFDNGHRAHAEVLLPGTDNPSDRKHPSCGRFRQRMEINVLGITNTLTSVGKDNMAYIEYE